MNWIKSHWSAEMLLPVLVAALHAAAVAPLIHLIGTGAFAIPVDLIPWPPMLAALGLGAFWSVHLLTKDRISLFVGRIASLIFLLACTAIWIGWQYGTVREDVFTRAPLFAAVLAFVAWWRGLMIGSDPNPFRPAHVRRMTQIAWLVLTVVLTVAAISGSNAAKDALASGRVAVPIAIICGLLAVAAGEIEQARQTAIRHGGRAPGRGTWLGFAGVAALLVTVVALVVGGVISQDTWRILAWPIVTAFWLLSQVVLYLVIAVAFVAFFVIYPIFWLLRFLLSGGEPPKRPEAMPGPTDFKQFAETAQSGVPGELLQILRIGLVVAVIAVGVVLLLSAMRRYGNAEAENEADEQRESLWSRELAKSQLRNLFARRQAEKETPVPDLSKEPATVREAFRFLSFLAERDAAGRRSTESASDFAQRLEQTWPNSAESVADLAERYLRVRYGEQPDTAEIGAVRSAWRTIWHRRTQQSP